MHYNCTLVQLVSLIVCMLHFPKPQTRRTLWEMLAVHGDGSSNGEHTLFCPAIITRNADIMCFLKACSSDVSGGDVSIKHGPAVWDRWSLPTMH